MSHHGRAGLKLVLLGGFEAVLTSGALVSLPTKKAEGLLAYLALRPGQAYPRDKLIGLLWGDRDEEHARNSLRQTLYILRHGLTPGWSRILHIGTGNISVSPSAVEVDVQAFEALTREENPSALKQAVELYRGDLLDGFHVNEPAFEDWLVVERERLRELALDAHAKLLRHQCSERETSLAIMTARRLLAMDPLRETTHRTLMRLLVEAGRPEAALRQFETWLRLAREELGLEPQAETRDLYESIRKGRTRSGDGLRAGVPAKRAAEASVEGDGAVRDLVRVGAVPRERELTAKRSVPAEVETSQRLRRQSAESRARCEKLRQSTQKTVTLSMRLIVDCLRIVGALP